MYIGDFRLGDTFDFKFTTRTFSTGAPGTLAGTPSVAAYPGNSTTEVTAGITLSVDFDTRTGLNNVRIVATSGNGYATATNYAVVITAGTVSSVSVVGEVVAHFSIENRSALMPTTGGRTLDVSSTGEAGLDWGNIGSKTTSNALTATTIATTQKVDVDTIKTNPVVNAGTITFPTTATLASTTNITAGTITTATNLTNAPTAGDFTATMKTSLNNATPSVTVSDKTGFSLSAAGIQAIWDALTSALTTVGSIGKLLADNIDAVFSTRMPTTHINATGGVVDHVTLVDTTTTNTDMRGTDSAATAANLSTVDGNVTNLKSGIIFGSAVTGTLTTTQATTDLTYADNQLIGRILIVLTGSAAGEATDITAYANLNGELTFTALTVAMANGDTFKIV